MKQRSKLILIAVAAVGRSECAGSPNSPTQRSPTDVAFSRHGCGVPDGNLYKRIDYVYTLGARVLSTTRFGRAAPGADSPSDHAGLIGEIEIQ